MNGVGIDKRFELELDLKQPVSNREFEVVEGDTRNILEISLKDAGRPVDLTGTRVVMVFSHRGGKAMQDSRSSSGGVTVSGNTVTVALKTGSFAEGPVDCEMQLYGGSGHALSTTARFNFSCRRAIMDANVLTSQTQYAPLLGLIEQANAAIARAQSAIVAANTALDAATATGEVSLSVYLHVRYAPRNPLTAIADTPLSETPNDFVGLAVSDSPTAPVSASAYNWYCWRGEPGSSSFVHIRYATADPDTAAVTPIAEPSDYMGVCVSTSPVAPVVASDYAWHRIRGDAGVGVSSAVVTDSGRLSITLTDGSTTDAGQVVPATVSTAQISDSGRLILIRTDGTTTDAGRVVPIAVQTASIADNGKLVLTMTDGTIVTAGQVTATNAVIADDGSLHLTIGDNRTVNAGKIATPEATAGSTTPITAGAIHRELVPETLTVTLTNGAVYPFNDSATTVTLAEPRTSANYSVEIAGTGDGCIGEFVVSNKTPESFTLAYTGSARTVAVTAVVRGGELA